MTKAPPHIGPTQFIRLLKFGLLMAGLALIIMAHLRVLAAESPHWANLSSERLIRWLPDDCEKLSLCQYIRPTSSLRPYIGSVLLMLAAGALLLVLGKPTALPELPRLPAWKSHLAPSRWRVAYAIFALIALLYSLSITYPALAEKTFPSFSAWVINLVLVGIAIYCRDRAAASPSLLTYREIILLVLYGVSLLGLGMVFNFLPTGDVTGRVAITLAACAIFGGLWRSKSLTASAAILAGLTVAGMALYTYRLESWQYAFVGDEYGFYTNAIPLTTRLDPPHPLSPYGVYNQHPAFATYIHTATLQLYGMTTYGWRISEVMMVLLAVPALYGLMRTLASERAALFSVGVYLAAHHLLAFSKIGYNNLQALPVVLTALALCALAIQRQNGLGIYLAGVVGALAFFTFALAIPFLALPALLLGVTAFGKPKTWLRDAFNLIPMLAFFIIGVFLVFYPRLIDIYWLDSNTEATFFKSNLETDNRLTGQIFPNFLYAITQSVSDNFDSHYVYGPHLDSVSSCLMIVGLAWLMSRLGRSRITLFLLVAFLLGNFLVGGLAPFDYPGHTRTFLMIPFYAMFAGFGLDFLLSGIRLKRPHWQFAATVAVVGLLGGLMVYLNLVRFFVESEKYSVRSSETWLVKAFQTEPAATEFYFVSPEGRNQNIVTLFTPYGFDLGRFHFFADEPPETIVSQIQARANYQLLISPHSVYLEDWLATINQNWPSLKVDVLYDSENRVVLYRLTVKEIF